MIRHLLGTRRPSTCPHKLLGKNPGACLQCLQGVRKSKKQQPSILYDAKNTSYGSEHGPSTARGASKRARIRKTNDRRKMALKSFLLTFWNSNTISFQPFPTSALNHTGAQAVWLATRDALRAHEFLVYINIPHAHTHTRARTCAHAHAHTHALARTHARPHARPHARTPACPYTRPHTCPPAAPARPHALDWF